MSFPTSTTDFLERRIEAAVRSAPSTAPVWVEASGPWDRPLRRNLNNVADVLSLAVELKAAALAGALVDIKPAR
jgi:hypothetical protein